MQLLDIKAINVEIDLIIFNNNWILMDLPLVSKPIGWEWGIRTRYKILWPKVSCKRFKTKGKDRILIPMH